MELKQIKIKDLKTTKLNIKEGSITSKKKLKNSLEKYGQIYPILINKDLEIIKGQSIIKLMIELNWTSVWVNIIDIEKQIDIFNLKKLLFDTQDNLDILKISLIIKQFKQEKDINLISKETGINIEELINYIDLLKLDNLIKQKQNINQQKLF